MKKMILSVLAIAFSVFCYAQNNNTSAPVSEWLSSFNAVSISGGMNVKFIKVADTEAPKIVYDLKGAVAAKFKFEVKNKVLIVSDRMDVKRLSPADVVIYYNSLNKLTINQATVTFDKPIDGVMVDMFIEDQAVVSAQLNIRDLKLEIGGKSKVTLSGSVRYLSLYDSSSVLNASELVVMSAMVAASNSAEVLLNISERIEAKTSTGGKVSYSGKPEIVRNGSSFFGGQITQKE